MLALFFTPQIWALNISILDTGFCPKFLTKNEKIEVLNTIDLTDSVRLECKKEDLLQKRFHGQKVLDTFIKNYHGSNSITITPYIIFDKNKAQAEKYWQKAFSKSIQDKTDIYLIAAGLPYLSELALKNTPLSKIVFIASGTNTKDISKEHKLWPQELSKTQSNIYIIGDHYPKTKYDNAYVSHDIKYFENATLFFPTSDPVDNQFNGSSYAVSLGAAKILSICSNMRELSTCINEKKKPIEFDNKVIKYTLD